MATIQKRKNKNRTISYRVMIRPSDGLPAMYKTFPTFEEAKDWAAIEEGNRRQGIYFPEKLKKKHTVAELIDLYTEALPLLGVKSAEDILRHLKWWKVKIGKYTLNHINSDLIKKQRQELLEEVSPKGTRRSQATVNRYLASFSGALSYGVKDCEWLSVNPMFRIKKFKESEGRDRILSNEELSRLFEACKNSPNKLLYPFVLLAITTGARSGELLGLPWGCVQLNDGVIHLKDTKNGRPRVLALVGKALEILRTMFAQRDPEKVLVFPSKKRFGKLTLRKPWERALKEAKINGFRMHDLRHCFATYASESGASNIQLKAATGHQTLSQLGRYCHPDAGLVQELSKSVHDKIFSHLNSEKRNDATQSAS